MSHVIQGVRDYIHITDLAVGHILALKKIEENPGLKVRTSIFDLTLSKCFQLLDLQSWYW